MHLSIYTDGSSKGNPGPSSIGVVVYDHHGQIRDKIAKKIPYGTNNSAEYEAMRLGMIRAKELGATSLSCFTDSECLVHHILGIKRVHKDDLVNKATAIRKMIDNDFEHYNIQHVRREFNKEADRLANQAYKQEIDSLDY
jgi:ribonuclease HI